MRAFYWFAFILFTGAHGAHAAQDLGLVDEGDRAQIKLLPHQLKPINYLYTHQNIKGLLINHQMGTGKTFLAIGFAEKYPAAPVVVIAPRFIGGHWQAQLKLFGVKNISRYEFISYHDAPAKLSGRNLSNTIVILDEAHNLVRWIKSPEQEIGKRYSDLYIQLKQSKKILALTGTPIYNDEYDLAYVFNLLTPADSMPYNEEEFRLEYSSIKPWTSWGRGHMSESLILGGSAAIVLPFALAGIFGSPLALVSIPFVAPIFPLINYAFMPLQKHPLRSLSVNKFKSLTSRFVSFYEIEKEDLTQYPKKNLYVKEIDYNPYQFDFFLDFVENSLPEKDLLRILAESEVKYREDYVRLNSSAIQDRIRNAVGSGREIGNLSFVDDEGKVVEPAKFSEIVKLIKEGNIPSTVVYSSYYHNGILPFAAFLEKHGLKSKYAILRPDDSIDAQTRTIANYNEGKTKILLLHPEITEGISLKGTRQFHILEPVLNSTIFNQIVARAVRYQSHAHLPEAERYVDAYLWKAVINNWKPMITKLKKDNWRRRYSELSDWSLWGQGLTQIDKNADRKAYSPDTYAFIKLESLNENIESFRDILREYSIEK
jgi:hypothetical protein